MQLSKTIKENNVHMHRHNPIDIKIKLNPKMLRGQWTIYVQILHGNVKMVQTVVNLNKKHIKIPNEGKNLLLLQCFHIHFQFFCYQLHI